MFRLGGDLQVYLHREPIDFRAGINSLAVLVQETLTLLMKYEGDLEVARPKLAQILAPKT